MLLWETNKEEEEAVRKGSRSSKNDSQAKSYRVVSKGSH